MSFQLTDDLGRIWPPGFESELLDPQSPHCVMRRKDVQRQEAAKAGRKVAVETGAGWGNGTIDIRSRRLPTFSAHGATNPSERERKFHFKRSSPAYRAYQYLVEQRGHRLFDSTLASVVGLKPHDLRIAMAPAVFAGVVNAERRPGVIRYWVD